ncbi:hypothetical protein TSAR_009363, partial [Trichomalopsis sarcophagae]
VRTATADVGGGGGEGREGRKRTERETFFEVRNSRLKCHCDICSETNNTCETDGYCFASTNLDKDGITYAYSFMDYRCTPLKIIPKHTASMH